MLLAKVGGETAKQIYRFTKGDNDLALRFDLTVPLARYVAEHAVDLAFPLGGITLARFIVAKAPRRVDTASFTSATSILSGTAL